MLYSVLKITARIAIRIFCRKIIINKPELLNIKGPVLLAANHPNSFLDSVIIDTLFEQPVWSLARGDVFKNPFHTRLLTALRILPVYRTSEGVENLSENYRTFEACIEIFRKNGVINIFSEGKCVNEWHLRPLKKGTARLTLKAWEENIPLKVLPVGINYSSFSRFGKNIFLNFGEIMEQYPVKKGDADGQRHQSFNAMLAQQLQQLVYEIPGSDKQLQKQKLEISQSLLKKIVLALPAIAGWIIHAPLYYTVKGFTAKKTRDTGHYDSVMTAILLFSYPLYLLALVSLVALTTGSIWSLTLLLLLPFCAWALVQLKPQLDH